MTEMEKAEDMKADTSFGALDVILFILVLVATAGAGLFQGWFEALAQQDSGQRVRGLALPRGKSPILDFLCIVILTSSVPFVLGKYIGNRLVVKKCYYKYKIPTYDLQKNADPSKCNRFCPGSTGALLKEHFPSLKTLKIGDLGLFFLGYEKKVVWTIDSEIFFLLKYF